MVLPSVPHAQITDSDSCNGNANGGPPHFSCSEVLITGCRPVSPDACIARLSLAIVHFLLPAQCELLLRFALPLSISVFGRCKVPLSMFTLTFNGPFGEGRYYLFVPPAHVGDSSLGMSSFVPLHYFIPHSP